jgi:hypothetical protein
MHIPAGFIPERALGLEVFKEVDASMKPMISPGQYVLVSSWSYWQHQPDIESMLGARPHLIVRVQMEPRSVSVHLFGRKITLPLHAAPAVRFALSQERFAVRDLPGDLDDSGKLTLARRLIRKGC